MAAVSVFPQNPSLITAQKIWGEFVIVSGHVEAFRLLSRCLWMHLNKFSVIYYTPGDAHGKKYFVLLFVQLSKILSSCLQPGKTWNIPNDFSRNWEKLLKKCPIWMEHVSVTFCFLLFSFFNHFTSSVLPHVLEVRDTCAQSAAVIVIIYYDNTVIIFTALNIIYHFHSSVISSITLYSNTIFSLNLMWQLSCPLFFIFSLWLMLRSHLPRWSD